MISPAQFAPETLLVLSLIALLVGPILFYFANFNDAFLQGLDGFVLVAICGLVLLHILPHTVEDVGWIALPVIFAGLLIPTFVERMKGRFAAPTHTFTLVLALLGIILHAFTDGMALTGTPTHHGFNGGALPAAIILHRIPDGLTLWWLVRPLYGRWSAARTLILMAAATTVGFFFGQVAFSRISERGLGFFEAIVGGSLLHVIFHHEHPMRKLPSGSGWKWASGLGALLAAASVGWFDLHANLPAEGSTRTLSLLVRLAAESAPALVFAYLFSGLIQTYLPHAGVRWLKGGNTLIQSIKGMAFGLPLPICSCGVVPVYRSLILQGAPVAAAIAFFVATPEFSVDAFLLSMPLLGVRYTFLRLIFAGLVAVGMGTIVGRFAKRLPSAGETPPSWDKPPPPGGWPKFRHALRQGFVASFDDTGPWIIVGILIAALIEPLLKSSFSGGGWPGWFEVPLFALIGMPLYVCASGATPLVAVMLHAGVSPGAGLAFLLTGPATNATSFGVISKYNGKRTAVLFAVGMTAFAVASGLIVNLVYDPARLPDLFERRHEAVETLQTLCLGFLALLFCLSVLRRGPRALINEIVAFEDGGHSHAHDHTHGREHEPGKCCP